MVCKIFKLIGFFLKFFGVNFPFDCVRFTKAAICNFSWQDETLLGLLSYDRGSTRRIREHNNFLYE